MQFAVRIGRVFTAGAAAVISAAATVIVAGVAAAAAVAAGRGVCRRTRHGCLLRLWRGAVVIGARNVADIAHGRHNRRDPVE